LYEKKTMIYELYMKRKSKSVRDLINRYLLNKKLLEKKSKHLYKVRLRYLKLLLLGWSSQLVTLAHS
jgi:hypothetical protein